MSIDGNIKVDHLSSDDSEQFGCEQTTNLEFDDEYSFDIADDFLSEDDDELCEEEEKFECPQNFLEAIKRLTGLLVAVEFECADCCKKAVGILRCVKPDFVQLFRPPGKLVTVQIFCPGMSDCNTECACEANIRLDKIISVEQLADQRCPC